MIAVRDSVRFVKKNIGVRVQKAPRGGVWGGVSPSTTSLPRGPGKGLCPFPGKFLICSFKIVHSDAFSYANAKILLDIKCRERYVFLAIDGDIMVKYQLFINLVNLFPSSLSIATHIGLTATVGMCYRPEIILYQLQTQAAL